MINSKHVPPTRDELWEYETDPKARIITQQSLKIVHRVMEQLGIRRVQHGEENAVIDAVIEAVKFLENLPDENGVLRYKAFEFRNETFEVALWQLFNAKFGVVPFPSQSATPNGTMMSKGVAYRVRAWSGSVKDPAQRRVKSDFVDVTQ